MFTPLHNRFAIVTVPLTQLQRFEAQLPEKSSNGQPQYKHFPNRHNKTTGCSNPARCQVEPEPLPPTNALDVAQPKVLLGDVQERHDVAPVEPPAPVARKVSRFKAIRSEEKDEKRGAGAAGAAGAAGGCWR